MPHAMLLGGCRTPIGKFLGGLSSVPAPQLAATCIAESLRRAGIDAREVQEVILGQVLPAGVGQAPARQAALAAGLPDTIAAFSVNKMCGSGLKAVALAAQAIRAGDARCIVAGGMESMSRAPHLVPQSRQGIKFGNGQLLDHMIHDGLWCAFEQVGMGEIADATAEKHQVLRAEQDAFATESHRRAVRAAAEGWVRDEIVPVQVGTGSKAVQLDRDEGPRADASAAKLGELRPAFNPSGTVTAGNASQLSDGAATLIVTDEAMAAASSAPFKARIVATAVSGVAPKDIFIAPISAIEGVLRSAEMKMSDVDLFELNEAFAAQCLACMKPLGLDAERTNLHGGAIALGHPIGASGARVLVTLLHALARRDLRRGLAALCLGGGNAIAMIVERV